LQIEKKIAIKAIENLWAKDSRTEIEREESNFAENKKKINSQRKSRYLFNGANK
jgi:hypothetical protein